MQIPFISDPYHSISFSPFEEACSQFALEATFCLLGPEGLFFHLRRPHTAHLGCER